MTPSPPGRAVPAGAARVAGFEDLGGLAPVATVVARFEDLTSASASASATTAPASVAALDDPAPAGERAVPATLIGAADLARAGGHAGPAPAAELTDAGAVGSDDRRPGAAAERRSRRGPRGERPDPDPDADPEAVGRAICLRLLTDRARTRQELAQALRRKGVPDEAAAAVLERFSDVGLIDDSALADRWVQSRHAVRGLGRRALAAELRRKGVSDEVAGAALAEVDADAEEMRARQLVERKLRSMNLDTEEHRTVAARRLVGMLARKGYRAGTAYRVVKEVLAAHGADLQDG